MGRRRNVYLSDLNDADLSSYIEPLETYYKFSRIAKDLMRDGMKYRRLIETGRIFENGEKPKYYNMLPSNTAKISNQNNTFKEDLSSIKLKKREVSEKDIESKLLEF